MFKIGQSRPLSLLPHAATFILAVLFFYLPIDGGGFFAGPKALLALVIFPFTALALLMGRDKRPIPGDILAAGAAYFILLFLSTIFSTDRHQSLLELCFQLTGAAGFYLSFRLSADRGIIRPALHFLGLNLFMGTAIAFLYYTTSPGLELRASGQFFQPNILGSFIVLYLPALAGISLASQRKGRAFSAGAVAAFALACLLATRSRGGLLCALITLPFLLAIGGRFQARPAILKRAALIIAAGVLIFAAIKPGPVSSLKDLQPDTLEGPPPAALKSAESETARLHFWEAAARITAARPLLGSGPGTFGYQYPRYQKRIKFYSKYTHNHYLGIACQSGIPALAAFLFLLFAGGKRIFQSLSGLQNASPPEALGLWGLFLGLGACLIHLLVEVSFDFAGIFFPFWTIAGFLAGLGVSQAGEREEPAEKPAMPALSIAAALLIAALAVPPVCGYLSENLVSRGSALEYQGKGEEALRCYQKAMRLAPLSSEAARKISSAFYLLRQDGQALQWIDRAISLSPYRARLYLLRGKIQFDQGRQAQALEDYRKAISLDPLNQVLAYNYLGEFFMAAGKPDEALKVFKRVEDIYASQDISELWHFRGDTVRPHLALVYLNLGNIHLEQKDFDSATRYYRASIRQMESAPPYYGLGYAQYMKGNKEEALQSFLKVNSMDPGFPNTYLFISHCYRDLGNREEAAKYFQHYLRLKHKKDEMLEKPAPPLP
jgi:tetratricopeptide (TPR) repeat protein